MRPPAPLRLTILVAAITCLGLTMCARTKQASSPPAAPANVANPAPASPDAHPPGTGVRMELEEGVMGKKQPEYLPATKAPPGLYP